MRIRVTVELDLRDMTDDEYADAYGDEDSGPEGWVSDIARGQFGDLHGAIEGALDSEANPEMFAGTDLYCVTENAIVIDIKKATTPPEAA